MTILFAFIIFLLTRSEIRTVEGRNQQARGMGDVNVNPQAGGWIGLTADSAPPSEHSLALAGEITDSTLERAAAAFAFTDGQDRYTLTHTFISDQSVTIAKYGVFTEGGVLCFEKEITPVVLHSGDQITITHTVNLG